MAKEPKRMAPKRSRIEGVVNSNPKCAVIGVTKKYRTTHEKTLNRNVVKTQKVKTKFIFSLALIIEKFALRQPKVTTR
jgi:hypothetical protein